MTTAAILVGLFAIMMALATKLRVMVRYKYATRTLRSASSITRVVIMTATEQRLGRQAHLNSDHASKTPHRALPTYKYTCETSLPPEAHAISVAHYGDVQCVMNTSEDWCAWGTENENEDAAIEVS